MSSAIETAKRDRMAADTARCPYCGEINGHGLERISGVLVDCRGWKLDREAVELGRDRRSWVSAHRS